MSHCPYCKKKIAMSKAFCSRGCKDNYFALIQIQIPPQFIKNKFQRYTEADREKEIEKFSKHHGWRKDLVRAKFQERAVEEGFVVDETMSKDEKINLILPEYVLVMLYLQRDKKSRENYLREKADQFNLDILDIKIESDKRALELGYIK